MDVDEVNEQVNSVNQASDVLMQLRQQGRGGGEGEEQQGSYQQVSTHGSGHSFLTVQHKKVHQEHQQYQPPMNMQVAEAVGLSALSQLVCWASFRRVEGWGGFKGKGQSNCHRAPLNI